MLSNKPKIVIGYTSLVLGLVLYFINMGTLNFLLLAITAIVGIYTILISELIKFTKIITIIIYIFIIPVFLIGMIALNIFGFQGISDNGYPIYFRSALLYEGNILHDASNGRMTCVAVSIPSQCKLMEWGGCGSAPSLTCDTLHNVSLTEIDNFISKLVNRGWTRTDSRMWFKKNILDLGRFDLHCFGIGDSYNGTQALNVTSHLDCQIRKDSGG